MINVLIADDHPLMREGLKSVVAGTDDIGVAGTASNGQEAIEKLRKGHWDVVLLDISMPGMSGLEVLKQIRSQHPDLPVLILSVHPAEQYAVRAIRDGAAGYLDKENSVTEVVDAIRKAAAGGMYLTTAVAEQLALGVTANASRPSYEQLSDREYEVLCAIASGKAQTDIASDLSLSPKTISTYRTRILEKLQLKSTAELVHYALQRGLVD